MKIIYYSHTFFSDCDLPLIGELEKKGYEVFTYYHLSPWEYNAGLVELITPPCKDTIISASEIDEMKKYERMVKLNHIFFISNPHYRRFHIQKHLVWLKAFLHMKRQCADVIHITYQLSGLEKILYKLKLPIVMTVHDPFLHSGRYNEANEKRRIDCFSRAKKLVLLNNEMKEKFAVYYGISNDKIAISKLGEYSHIHNIKPEKCDFVEKNFILFFGYISKYKGLKYLLEAMTSVHRTRDDVELVIIGRGTFDFDISQYSKLSYIKIINRFATVSELSFLLQNCLFAICPYIDATQSGVIQTAFSAGCPVVVTNVGNLPTAVENGKYGVVVPPADSVNLAKVMCELLTDSHKLSLMRKNINEEWRQNMSWSPIAMDYIRIYEELKKVSRLS